LNPLYSQFSLSVIERSQCNISFKSEPIKPIIQQGFITVTSKPDGATVKSNGRELGKTPLVKYQLPVGKQVLEIEFPGYQPRSVEADISNGSINSLAPIVLVRVLIHD